MLSIAWPDITDKMLRVPADFWAVLVEMAPYLLFGFLIAGILSLFVSERLVERHLGGRGFWAVAKASAFGVPLPLCSCGVIPVAASLRRQGAGKGPTIAFLISTPQDGADSILVTYGLLGPVFAIFRPLMALFTGVAGGMLVNRLDGNTSGECHTSKADGRGMEVPNGHGRIYRVLHYGFVALPRDIGKALIIGLLAAALVSAAVPRDYFADLVPPGILQILVLMAVAMPIYVCATASVPLAYAMILAGVSPGAAFAFLMTGPATNAATITTVWKVMGPRTAVVYLTTMAVAAVGGGLMLDEIMVFTGEQASPAGMSMLMLPPALQHAAAVVLSILLVAALAHPVLQKMAERGRWKNMAIKLKVTGMTCSHCADRVRKALLACPGVSQVYVDVDHDLAAVEGNVGNIAELVSAVEDAGYDAEPLGAQDEEGEQLP